jgi:hypothetical protein
MPLQNRVTPEGEIIATPHRGLLMGNRGGPFHLPNRTLRSRRWHSKQWIACVLDFKNRHRPAMMQPNRYTELFFLDEATALAAGHRPCFECRRRDALRFAELWNAGRGLAERARASEMDAVLHAERVAAQGRKLTFRARMTDLPVGTFVRYAAQGAQARPYLIAGRRMLAWTPAGYADGLPTPTVKLEAEVLTPLSIVAAFAAGYRPLLHASAAVIAGDAPALTCARSL